MSVPCPVAGRPRNFLITFIVFAMNYLLSEKQAEGKAGTLATGEPTSRPETVHDRPDAVSRSNEKPAVPWLPALTKYGQ
jgi:hypothetical protein